MQIMYQIIRYGALRTFQRKSNFNFNFKRSVSEKSNPSQSLKSFTGSTYGLLNIEPAGQAACYNVRSSKMLSKLCLGQERLFYTSQRIEKDALSSTELKRAMDDLTEQFMEARELIDDARESMDTVYFSEDMTEAQEAVKATLDKYQTLLGRLSEDQRQEVLRTIGLRMEELKAQEQAIKDTLHDSH